MNHRQARRLLPAILDHSIPAQREAAVRSHAEECGRCGQILEELEADECLLRMLPASLVPLVPSPASNLRLAGLARWAPPPEPLWTERLGLSAVGAFAATVVLFMVLSVGGWAPVVHDDRANTTFAASLIIPGIAPLGWR